MKIEKNNTLKTKATNRKAVVQSIAKQEVVDQKPVVNHSQNPVIKSSQNPVTKSSKNSQDLQEAIRIKAYELFLERGGCDRENWLDAEKIILKASR